MLKWLTYSLFSYNRSCTCTCIKYNIVKSIHRASQALAKCGPYTQVVFIYGSINLENIQIRICKKWSFFRCFYTGVVYIQMVFICTSGL